MIYNIINFSSQDLDELPSQQLDPICDLKEWSAWSGCSVTCGRGVHTRTRTYKSRKGHKHCSHLHNAPILQQMDDCFGEDGMSCGNSEEEGENIQVGLFPVSDLFKFQKVVLS